MKSIIFIPVFLISLFNMNSQIGLPIGWSNLSDTSKPISKAKFKSYFVGLDTLKAKEDLSLHKVVSCIWGTYKFIGKNYIIRVNTELFSKRLDNFYEINISPNEAKDFVELLVYDKLDATLENICTDVGYLNNPRPTRHIKAQTGQLFIGFTKPSNSYDQYDVTILIKSIDFVDPLTKQLISFKNELVWKVFYDGIPG